MFKFQEFLGASVAITIVDVGAASMGEGSDAYAALTGYAGTTLYGFEPNADACRLRNAQATANQTFLPYFIGDGSARTFHECENPLTSSLYEPDADLLARFQRLDLPVKQRVPVQTTRLDDAGLPSVDFLKLDIQGAELDAIRGGPHVLADVLVVHTEIEFIPMYRGQALFGDIDVALRAHGLMFHQFIGLFSRQFKPVMYRNDPFSAGSQLIYAEAAVYVRDLAQMDRAPREQVLKLVTVLHDVYRSYDLAAHLLDGLDRREGSALMERYVRSLVAGRAVD